MVKLLTMMALIFGMGLMGCTPRQSENLGEDGKVSVSPTPAPSLAPAPPKPLLVVPENPDPEVMTMINNYLDQLEGQGFPRSQQGIWFQTSEKLLANYQGTIPLSAASITKMATTLAALKTFNPDHQFITKFSTNGRIENGVLMGDLIVEGNQDPLFVWEEAIAVGNRLNEMGIKQVTGNLIIIGQFYMNFEANPQTAGNVLKQGLNSQIWPGEADQQYETLPPGTPRPQVKIDGRVQVANTSSPSTQVLLEHESLPLVKLTKKMNLYSNNLMADMLADAVGGPSVVAKIAADAVGVPGNEIQLINGSGLGEENKISPRAACGLFLAIERLLSPENLTIADVAAVIGEDAQGILNQRSLPNFAVVKSGSLNYVSTLAGQLPTETQNIVCFAIMNGGGFFEDFRSQQESLLNNLVRQWGAVTTAPPGLKSTR